MLPIPSFIMEKILPGLIHRGVIEESLWTELQYSVHPSLLPSIEAIEAATLAVSFDDLPELTGTTKQIDYAQNLRRFAIRAEAALQYVLVGSKVMRFSLSPGVKQMTQSKFWIDCRGEVTRRFKATLLNSTSEFDLYKVPKDSWPYNSMPIWQADRVNYSWEMTEPEFQGFRDEAERSMARQNAAESRPTQAV